MKKTLFRASRKNKVNMKVTWKIINCLMNKKVKEQFTQHNLIAVRPKSQVAKLLLIVLIIAQFCRYWTFSSQ